MLQDPSEADGFSKGLDDRNGEAMWVEDFYRQTGVLMAEEMADFQKMRGYLLEETAFMEGKKCWPLKAALSQAEIVFLLRRTSLSCRRAIISV